MCLQEVFGVDPANADHQSHFGWSVPLEVGANHGVPLYYDPAGV